MSAVLTLLGCYLWLALRRLNGRLRFLCHRLELVGKQVVVRATAKVVHVCNKDGEQVVAKTEIPLYSRCTAKEANRACAGARKQR
jgi:hypothetical protein